MTEDNQHALSKRVHARFNVAGIQMASATLANNNSFELRDVSYSGFSIAKDFTRIASEELTLNFLDQKILTSAKLVHSANNISGFAFKHENVATLVFLQPILERMRIGSTLVKINPSSLRSNLQDGTWMVLEGDGPTTIRIKNNGGPVEETYFSAMLGGLYYELRITNTTIQTFRQQDSQGDAPRMAESANPDRTTIRAAIYTMVAIADTGIRECLTPVLKRLVAATQT